jgi:hypothetical protein
MFAHPKLAARRRWKRRLKAAGSLAIALAAGTFLACQRQMASMFGEGGLDAGARLPGSGPSEAASGGVAPSAEESGAPDAALAVADARARTNDRPSDAAVDVREHRKGMPVPDNLLE